MSRVWSAGFGKLLALSVAGILSACAEATVYGTFPREIVPEEKVGVVLLSYEEREREDGSQLVKTSVASKESFFTSCVANGIQRGNEKVVARGGAEVWEVFLPGTPPDQWPRSRSELDRRLRETASRKALTQASFRYLVALDVSTKEYGGETNWDANGSNGLLLMGFDYSWTRDTTLSASIFDVAQRGDPIAATAHCSGGEGVGCFAGCCLIPPYFVLPFALPIPFTTMTESHSCEALGKRIGQELTVRRGDGG